MVQGNTCSYALIVSFCNNVFRSISNSVAVLITHLNYQKLLATASLFFRAMAISMRTYDPLSWEVELSTQQQEHHNC